MSSYSDDTCIALQLANFWQDVARDHGKGRIYIPMSDMDEFGVELSTIRKREPTPEFRRLMKFQVDRTRELFRTGYQLHDHLQRDFRLEFSAITAGGLSVLNAIEALDYDTLTVRPTVSRSTKIRIMLKIIASQPNRHDTGSSECVCQSFGSMSGCSLLNIRCRNQPTSD